MIGEAKDHTVEQKSSLPNSSPFDDVRNVVRPDGSCDYRDENGHGNDTLDQTGRKGDDAELRKRVKSASKSLFRNGNMLLKQASSRNLLVRPSRVSMIDQKWGHEFAVAMGIHRDLLAGVGNGSDLITLILDCSNATIEKKLEETIQNITMRLQSEVNVLEGVTSIAHYVNLRDEAGCTALHHICDRRMENPIPLAGMLLDVGAHIDMQASATGFTPLHLAIRRHQVGLALYLLERGAAANIKTLSEDADDDLPQNQENSTFESEDSDDEDIEAKQASWRGHFNESPLHMAAKFGLVSVVQKLLEMGANPNDRAYDGKTPLHYSFEKNREYKAVYLAARLATHAYQTENVEMRKRNRVSWEHIKATTFEQENPSARITKMLIDAGADLTRVADDGTPAMSDLDVEFWYHSHVTQMKNLIGYPNLNGTSLLYMHITIVHLQYKLSNIYWGSIYPNLSTNS